MYRKQQEAMRTHWGEVLARREGAGVGITCPRWQPWRGHRRLSYIGPEEAHAVRAISPSGETSITSRRAGPG